MYFLCSALGCVRLLSVNNNKQFITRMSFLLAARQRPPFFVLMRLVGAWRLANADWRHRAEDCRRFVAVCWQQFFPLQRVIHTNTHIHIRWFVYGSFILFFNQPTVTTGKRTTRWPLLCARALICGLKCSVNTTSASHAYSCKFTHTHTHVYMSAYLYISRLTKTMIVCPFVGECKNNTVGRCVAGTLTCRQFVWRRHLPLTVGIMMTNLFMCVCSADMCVLYSLSLSVATIVVLFVLLTVNI